MCHVSCTMSDGCCLVCVMCDVVLRVLGGVWGLTCIAYGSLVWLGVCMSIITPPSQQPSMRLLTPAISQFYKFCLAKPRRSLYSIALSEDHHDSSSSSDIDGVYSEIIDKAAGRGNLLIHHHTCLLIQTLSLPQ